MIYSKNINSKLCGIQPNEYNWIIQILYNIELIRNIVTQHYEKVPKSTLFYLIGVIMNEMLCENVVSIKYYKSSLDIFFQDIINKYDKKILMFACIFEMIIKEINNYNGTDQPINYNVIDVAQIPFNDTEYPLPEKNVQQYCDIKVGTNNIYVLLWDATLHNNVEILKCISQNNGIEDNDDLYLSTLLVYDNVDLELKVNNLYICIVFIINMCLQYIDIGSKYGQKSYLCNSRSNN